MTVQGVVEALNLMEEGYPDIRGGGSDEDLGQVSLRDSYVAKPTDDGGYMFYLERQISDTHSTRYVIPDHIADLRDATLEQLTRDGMASSGGMQLLDAERIVSRFCPNRCWGKDHFRPAAGAGCQSGCPADPADAPGVGGGLVGLFCTNELALNPEAA